MLMSNNIVQMDNNRVVFLNPMAMGEAFELMAKILNHMTDDLSKITGIPKEIIADDYKYLNNFSALREVCKKSGTWNKEDDISLVLKVMKEGKFNE